MRMQMIQRFANGETDPIFGVFGDSRLRGGSHRTGERCRLLPICRISCRLRCPARCGAAPASGRACRYASRGDPGSWCGRYPHEPWWPCGSRRPPLIAKTSRAAPSKRKHRDRDKVRPCVPAAHGIHSILPTAGVFDMGTLTGKSAVVTGSTSGIGLACARAFAGAGANVVINGFGTPADIEQERSSIEKDFKVKAVHSPADMSKPDEIAKMIALGQETFGSVDILVNNAGIQFVSPIEEFPPEKWEAIIAINLSAAFYAIRAAVPGMKKRGWGRIINTASAHSMVASPFKAAYVAAKHGIAGLTKTAALELATFKITCNCISPGYVWTPLVEKQIPDTMKARNLTKEQVIHDVLLEAQPTKEFVTSEQVAALALFLCGDDAAQITGANLAIDGGWTAG